MQPFLELRRLRITLGDFVLGEISLTLACGDYLVLLGPSGCGKTTLLRAIAGLYRLGAGCLFLGERDIGCLPPQRRGVGYVAQTADLFPHLTVAENIAFGLRYTRGSTEEKRRWQARIVDLLGVRHLMSRWPGTLSGGESRRVALARSLVVNPRVLLLDEPLGMLDSQARAEMLNVLRCVHAELGTATIHVTHDREEAWAIAGRCAVMRAGRIEQVGTVEELFRQPRTRFVAEFLGGGNVFPARFERRGHRYFALLGWANLEVTAYPGDSGYIQIRPESLIVEPRPLDNTEGVLTGCIRQVADRGIYRELVVEVRPDVVLRAHTLAGSGPFRVGEMVALRCASPPHPISADEVYHRNVAYADAEPQKEASKR